MHKLKRFQSIINLFFIILIVCFVYFLIKWILIYFYPFLIALVLAFSIQPIVMFLEKRYKVHRLFATIFIVFSLSSLFIGFMFIVLSELIQGTSYLAEKVPNYFQTFIHFIEQFVDLYILGLYNKVVSFLDIINLPENGILSEYINEFTSNIAIAGGDLLRNLLLKIPLILSKIPQSIAIIMIILLATILITNELDKLKKLAKKILPASSTSFSKNIFVHIQQAFSGFLKAQCILISINALIIFIGLILMKVEHALTISLLATAVDIFPFIGTGVIFIPWIIYTFFTSDYVMTIELCFLYIFIVILRQALEPKILSVHVGISPLATLIILFLSVKLWGVFGVIIAPFLLIILSALYRAGVFERMWRFIID